MATLLEQRLKECCEQDITLAPLLAQWGFDKILVAKALQSVGNMFPHYSRHDESHSRQILVNIERILGPTRIAQISGTDVWFLLEAAYLHDIGMVVTQQEKELDWKSEEFRLFLEAQGVQSSDRYSADDLLRGIENPMESLSRGENPLDWIARISQLLAEFYRRKHADRSASIVSQPFVTIGLNSPRNELIAKRLFLLLGDICAMHGKGHADLMRLPAIASGLGKDKIHPRFIACMLRLGDLLDLDDNRFCPVMLRVAGQLPTSTHAHIDKHLAVRHLRIDSERIEVHAACSTYDGYVESERWFDYLRREVAWQMAHWADIVPDNRFGLLPTIGNITTELKGYQLIDNASRPHFELDQPKVMELLQGAGLYTSHRDSLRELLQNAIDATLLFIWLRHGKGEADDLPESQTIHIDDNPYGSKVVDILSRYPIEIKILRIDSASSSNRGTGAVEIQIRDNGVGISQEDLKGMSKIGRSGRGTWKYAVFDRMPLWMRPSGAFGIGLQSAFMLTDEILFRTKSVKSGEELLIRMSNPVGPEEGSIYIQRENSQSLARGCGTTLELIISSEKERALGFSKRVREYFDPIVGRSPSYFEDLLDNVPVPIFINGVEQRRSCSELEWHYNSSSGIAVAFDFSSRYAGLRLYFKGQRITAGKGAVRVPCDIHVNIFDRADLVLSVNRRELRNSDVLDRIVPSIVSVAQKLYSDCLVVDQKAMLSATLLALRCPNSDDYLDMAWEKEGDLGGRRLNYVGGGGGRGRGSATIGRMLENGMSLYQAFGDYSPRYVVYGNDYMSCTFDSIYIFYDAIVHQGYKGYIKSILEKGVLIGLSKNVEAWDQESLVKLLLVNLQDGLRLALPVTSRFKKLASVKWTPWVGELSRGIFFPGQGVMYSPFIVQDDVVTTRDLDRLIDWTFENRDDKTVGLEEIKDLYCDFIKYVDDAMQGQPAWKRANFGLSAAADRS